ncbi:MAG TPA: hypothetical protein VNN81_10920 [Bradyrhizobium sp.]|nr:hypothetical protein [Bradyrhizobium sp.]
MAEALQRIDFHSLRREHGLSLVQMNVLEQLRYGKMNLRQAVQHEVNLYGQDGVKLRATIDCDHPLRRIATTCYD